MLRLLIFAILLSANTGQTQSAQSTVAWYNGDWQSGIPGQGNFFTSGSRYARVYDDFVVPESGWTVVGVFSQNNMYFTRVTKAAWEIRKDMAPGKGGKKVASGTSRARQIPIDNQGPFPGDYLAGYRIQVDGLRVRLAPGRYWLSVAPVGEGKSFANATVGKNAVGDPPGNNGSALLRDPRTKFRDAESLSAPGQRGKARDFSQGVIIDAAAR